MQIFSIFVLGKKKKKSPSTVPAFKCSPILLIQLGCAKNSWFSQSQSLDICLQPRKAPKLCRIKASQQLALGKTSSGLQLQEVVARL